MLAHGFISLKNKIFFMQHVTIESFLKKVYPEPNTGCWLWGGLHDKNGYGRVSPKKFKLRNAHRLSYFFYKGDFDRSLMVLHKCDVPACVNPDHLFLGTVQDNSDDMKNKKRQANGERQWKSKLTEDQVFEIRRYYNIGISAAQISRIYGTSAATIHRIITYKSWTHAYRF
jgi:hypothetical protein